MLLLVETSLGYLLFNVDDNKFNQIKSYKDIPDNFNSFNKICKLKEFKKFNDSKEGLQAAVKMIYGKLSNTLKKFIIQNEDKEKT